MSAFSIVIPGVIPLTPVQFDPTTWIAPIANPASIAEICVVLGQPLASSEVGVGVSFRIPPATETQFLGVLTNARPSDIFSTGCVAGHLGSSYLCRPWILDPTTVQEVHLVLSVEPASALLERLAAHPAFDVKKELARRTALNLYHYIQSYQEAGPQLLLRDSSKVLDSWFARFKEKYDKDPNFMLRSGE